MLKGVAESMLARELPEGEELEPLSEKWAKRFMKRHALKKVKQKPIKLARKEAHEPSAIRT